MKQNQKTIYKLQTEGVFVYNTFMKIENCFKIIFKLLSSRRNIQTNNTLYTKKKVIEKIIINMAYL